MLQHPISILAAEHARLAAEFDRLNAIGKPKAWRGSEWAMTLGALSRRKQQCFEALQILRGVGKD